MRKIIILLILVSLAHACDISKINNDYVPELVVEGWIENGHSPIVFVSQSIPATTEPITEDDISQSILKNADVCIIHNGDSIRLTPRLSDKYKLKNYYTSDNIKGEVGEFYTLCVKWKNYEATATSYIPKPCPIDTVYIKTTERDTCYIITSVFNNCKADMNYYQYFVKDNNEAYKSVKFTALDGQNLPEGPLSIDITRQKNEDCYFHPGDSATIKLATTSEEIFDFWNRFNDATSVSDNTIAPIYINCKGNINGGLGYWAGYGISQYRIRVPELNY